MNELCTDIGYNSLYKKGEQLCGDNVEVVERDENSVVVVLADGLGSGVKANILSTLTAKIISTMMANQMSLEDCVSTIASTLPVCEVRKVAYSTFTIIQVLDNREAEIIQYDNPGVILLRGGKHAEIRQDRANDRRQKDLPVPPVSTRKRRLSYDERRLYSRRRGGAAQLWLAAGKYY